MFKWFKKTFSNEEDIVEDDLTNELDIEKDKGIDENVNSEKIEEPEVITTLPGEPTYMPENELLNDDSSEERESVEEVVETIVEDNEEYLEANIDTEDVIEEQDEIIEEVNNESEEEIVEEAGFWGKLFSGLNKTRENFTQKITTVLGGYVEIDDELYEDLEDILISADVGMETTIKLIDRVKDNIYENKVKDPNLVKDILADEIKAMMKESVEDSSLNVYESPSILLVVGVNGVGKTTTIGKLSYRFKNEGKKVLIAAADTFRAAAIEQLEEWANRANVEIVSHQEGADPAAVVFDGIQAAKSRNTDILICDTAGRLHNKSNLMNELNKIFRILDTNYSEANKEVLLVLDATTGQNALIQAKTFKEAANITGVALTKLDGTAKGGIVIALQNELQIPVKLIGVGEGINDLQNFDVDTFVDALFE